MDGEKQLKNSSDDLQRQLSALIKKVGDSLKDECHEEFAGIFRNHEFFELETGAPVPLEIWIAIAQAMADASGFRLVLQSHLVESCNDHPGHEKVVGYRDVAIVAPTLWISV